MDFDTFNMKFTTDFNLDTLSVRRGHWPYDKYSHRLDKPRRINGLYLITDHPAEFLLPNGERLQGRRGDLFLLPKGSLYDLHFSVPEGQEALPLLINFRMTDIEGRELTTESPVRLLCRDEQKLAPLFAAALHHYESAASPAALKAVVFEIFSHVFPLKESDPLCLGYIHRHYTAKFSIPLLAKRCALSESAYRKQFKEQTGLSPVQYINRLKIEKACLMLAHEEMRPVEISDLLGFYSLAYFYKVFKSITGLTPREYVRQNEMGRLDSSSRL